MTERNSDNYERQGQLIPPLTPRQREVLMLIANGYSAKEISEQLGISTKTVYTYKAKLRASMRNLQSEPAIKRENSATQNETANEPPKNAELLLSLLLRQDEQDSAIGCFSELFAKKVQRLGRKRAVIWAWCDVLRTLCPVIKRNFLRISGLAATVEWLRRHFS